MLGYLFDKGERVAIVGSAKRLQKQNESKKFPVRSLVRTPTGRLARVTGHDSEGRLQIIYIDADPPWELGIVWPKLVWEVY